MNHSSSLAIALAHSSTIPHFLLARAPSNKNMAPSIISAAACALAIFAPTSTAFAPVATHTARCDATSLSATTDRRGFMGNVASATAAIAGVSSAWLTPGPALAYGVKKANEKLAR